MQKKSSKDTFPNEPNKWVKMFLIGFVILSVSVAVYKIANSPCCDSNSRENSSYYDVSSKANTEEYSEKKNSDSKTKTQSATDKNRQANDKKAIVYYFHTTARCYSCKLIEDYTRETIEQNFPKPYKGWNVEFKGINVEIPENRHFIQDYWLTSKSIVAQKFEGDKALNWILLKDVWFRLDNKNDFMNYVTTEIRRLLDGK